MLQKWDKILKSSGAFASQKSRNDRNMGCHNLNKKYWKIRENLLAQNSWNPELGPLQKLSRKL